MENQFSVSKRRQSKIATQKENKPLKNHKDSVSFSFSISDILGPLGEIYVGWMNFVW